MVIIHSELYKFNNNITSSKLFQAIGTNMT